MAVFEVILFVLSTLFSVLYFYQVIFSLIGFFSKKKSYPDAKEEHTFAICICGRNEEKVIGNLIESIQKSDYPMDKLRIFVCADNCTDSTAEVCRSYAGVAVYERQNKEQIGKGYALNFLFKHIAEDYPDYTPDATFIFDADNILTKNYIKEMNKALDSGIQICTSFRNSKNFDDSWISESSSLCFMRECTFTHRPKTKLGLNTHVSGTGFYFSKDVLTFKDGWKHTTITEDIEFSAFNTIKGVKIGYCEDAEFYDEQPVKLKTTWKQRLRWSRGGVMGFSMFHSTLCWGFLKTLNFSYYDYYFARFFPVGAWYFFYFIASNILNTMTHVLDILNAQVLPSVIYVLSPILLSFLTTYLGTFADGMLATIANWKKIKAPTKKKIQTMLVYPLFIMFVSIPTGVVALFKKVKWDPIEHSASISQEELEKFE